jgi:hypothetical protein
MHRPRHRHHVFVLKLSSLLFLGALLAALATMALSLWILARGDRSLFPWFLTGIFLTASLLLTFRIRAHAARCPLCHAQPLLARFCVRHRKARKLAGSHRLRVAWDILRRNRFLCPYCGEPTKCVSREDALAIPGADKRTSG